MTVDATLTAPTIPDLPPEAMKVRIDTWFSSFVVSNGKKIHFDLSLDFDAILTLRQLSQFFQLLSWSEMGPISFSIIGDGFPIAEGQMKLGQGQDDISYVKPSNMISKLLDITHRSGVEMPSLSPASLGRNWAKCAQFYNYLMTDGAELKVTLDRVISPDLSPQCMVGFIELDLETAAFLAVLEFPVKSEERSGNDMSFSLAAPLIRDCYVGSSAKTVRKLGERQSAEFGGRTGKTIIKVGSLFDHPTDILQR